MNVSRARYLAAVLFPALLATEAHAGCVLDDKMTMKQSNGYTVKCSFDQNGTQIEGFCSVPGNNNGDVSGFLKKGRLKITVKWDGGSRGIYTGHVEDDGSLVDGRTYDAANPGSWATWRFTGRLRCSQFIK